MTIDDTQTMRPAEIDIVNEINKQGKQLFNGTWQANTTITIPDLDKYMLFAVYLTNESVPIIVFSKSTFSGFRGSGGTITAASTPRGYLYSIQATRPGANQLRLAQAAYQRIDNHTVTSTTVSEIWGIL